MYVCVCNGLKEAEVVAAARSGCSTTCPRETYARLGKKPQCGICLGHARSLLEAESGSAGDTFGALA